LINLDKVECMNAKLWKELIEEIQTKKENLSLSNSLLRLKVRVEAMKSPLHAVQKEMINDMCQSTLESIHHQLSIATVTGAKRGKGVLSTLHSLFERSDVEAQQEIITNSLVSQTLKHRESMTLSLCGTLGPSLLLSAPLSGVLLPSVLCWDVIEDYLALSHKLEVLPPSSDVALSTSTQKDASGVSRGEGDRTGEQEFFSGLALPVSWVSGVGNGRESDKVGSYCRFSDVLSASEDGFISSAEPSALCVFRDLSKYEGPGLELFCHENLQGTLPSDSQFSRVFTVDYSQSNINAGEKHESLKLLCDLIYSPIKFEPAKLLEMKKKRHGMPTHGLRLLVHRGGQLDVGLFHVDPQRRKFTLELSLLISLSRDELRQHLHIYNGFTIAERRTDRQLIWKWFFDDEGVLSFSFSDENSSRTIHSTFSLFSLSSTESVRNSSERDVDGENNFLHLCLSIDSSQSTVNIVAKNNESILVHTPVSLAMIVDGEEVLAASPGTLQQNDLNSFIPNDISEIALSQSYLFIMPCAMIPYRLTEVRIWAMRRSLSELREQRDLSLPLAEKRLRIAMNMKGAKKLFTSFKAIMVPLQSSQMPASKVVLEKEKPTENETIFLTNNSFSAPTPSSMLPPKVSTLVDSSTTLTSGFGGNAAPPVVGGGARAKRLQAKQQQSTPTSTPTVAEASTKLSVVVTSVSKIENAPESHIKQLKTETLTPSVDSPALMSPIQAPVISDDVDRLSLPTHFSLNNYRLLDRSRLFHVPMSMVIITRDQEMGTTPSCRLQMIYSDVESEITLSKIHSKSVGVPESMIHIHELKDKVNVALSVRNKVSGRFALAIYQDKIITVYDICQSTTNM
jgi:hypothetical protein